MHLDIKASRCYHGTNMLRTTVGIADQTHEYLMLRAIREKRTIGQIIDELALVSHPKLSVDEQDKQIENDLAFFRLAGRKIKKKVKLWDGTKIVREERDRDNA